MEAIGHLPQYSLDVAGAVLLRLTESQQSNIDTSTHRFI